jgi:hypothetical protein
MGTQDRPGQHVALQRNRTWLYHSNKGVGARKDLYT